MSIQAEPSAFEPIAAAEPDPALASRAVRADLGRRHAAPRRPGAVPGGHAVLRALWTAWCAPDPRAAVRAAVLAASSTLVGASGEEPAWYALLRGLEMLGEAGPLRLIAARAPSLLAAAEEQVRRFPSSPRLAALRARLEGGAAAARVALAVNPAYAPAQVVLARALLREGSPQAARALLEAIEQPQRIQGGAAALARARVETGDPGQALLAAARETNAPGLAALEPSIRDPAIDREVDEVRGLARLALGAVEAGARSLLRAAIGSQSARRALVDHAGRAEVRQALSRLTRDASLTVEARALAGVLAG